MSVSMLTTCFMFIVNGKCLRWLFHYDAKLSYHQHYQNIFFFCSLRVCVCVLSWYFLPFSSFTCCFFRYIWVFFSKKKKFFDELLQDCHYRHHHCYQRLLWMLFASVCRSVGPSVGWMTGCVFVLVCVLSMYSICFFYLFIEFNSFTVGCWQTHFQIANNVQFSRFITFCGNKTNWIICALLCFERISVFTYISTCIYVLCCSEH